MDLIIRNRVSQRLVREVVKVPICPISNREEAQDCSQRALKLDW